MKMTHEAFRFAIPKLRRLVEATDTTKIWTVRHLLYELKPFITAFNAHSHQEEKVLFPIVWGFFPNLNSQVDADHVKLHNFVDRVDELMKKVPDELWADHESAILQLPADLGISLNELKADFPAWFDLVLEHLRDEEQSITVVIRKYVSLARQKEATQRAFDVTSTEDWHIVIPFVLKNLAVPMWKVRFLRTFVWAMPDRAQEIGLIVYRGVDSVLWTFIAEEIPEMIPRGLAGFRRCF